MPVITRTDMPAQVPGHERERCQEQRRRCQHRVGRRRAEVHCRLEVHRKDCAQSRTCKSCNVAMSKSCLQSTARRQPATMQSIGLVLMPAEHRPYLDAAQLDCVQQD